MTRSYDASANNTWLIVAITAALIGLLWCLRRCASTGDEVNNGRGQGDPVLHDPVQVGGGG